MSVLPALIALGGIAGLVVRRAWVIPVAATSVVGYYLGLDSGWWGNGTGDGWQALMVIAGTVAAAVAWGGIIIGRSRTS